MSEQQPPPQGGSRRQTGRRGSRDAAARSLNFRDDGLSGGGASSSNVLPSAATSSATVEPSSGSPMRAAEDSQGWPPTAHTLEDLDDLRSPSSTHRPFPNLIHQLSSQIRSSAEATAAQQSLNRAAESIRKSLSFGTGVLAGTARISELKGLPTAPRVPRAAMDLSTAAELLRDQTENDHRHILPPSTLAHLGHPEEEGEDTEGPHSEEEWAGVDGRRHVFLPPGFRLPELPKGIPGFAGSAEPRIDKLTLVTFNAGLLAYKLCGVIWYENPPFARRRLRYVPAALKASDADVIALQEVLDEEQADYIIESLRLVYPFVGRRTSGGLFQFHNGLMILSRFPIIQTRFTLFRSVTCLENSFCSKGLLEVSVEIPGIGPVTFLNLHLASGAVDPESEYLAALRNEEIDQALEAADMAVARQEVPIMIGDLNAGPNTTPENYHRFLHEGWSDCFVEAKKFSASCDASSDGSATTGESRSYRRKTRRRQQDDQSSTYVQAPNRLKSDTSPTADPYSAASSTDPRTPTTAGVEADLNPQPALFAVAPACGTGLPDGIDSPLQEHGAHGSLASTAFGGSTAGGESERHTTPFADASASGGDENNELTARLVSGLSRETSGAAQGAAVESEGTPVVAAGSDCLAVGVGDDQVAEEFHQMRREVCHASSFQGRMVGGRMADKLKDEGDLEAGAEEIEHENRAAYCASGGRGGRVVNRALRVEGCTIGHPTTLPGMLSSSSVDRMETNRRKHERVEAGQKGRRASCDVATEVRRSGSKRKGKKKPPGGRGEDWEHEGLLARWPSVDAKGPPSTSVYSEGWEAREGYEMIDFAWTRGSANVDTEPEGEVNFTWDPKNPLNTIGPHSGCNGQRCDHIFLPRAQHRRQLADLEPQKGDVIFREPRVMVEGCCFGCYGSAMLVTLSDHYAVRLEFHRTRGRRGNRSAINM